jgi:hypothetical protein
MPKKIFSVQLSTEERQQLQSSIHHGQRSARSINRARILLLADAQGSDDEITTVLGVNRATVHRIRKSYYSWFAHFLRGFKNCGRVSGAKEVPHGRDPDHPQ